MRRLFLIPMLLAALNSFACSGAENFGDNPAGNGNNGSGDDPQEEPTPIAPGDGNILVAYFSYPEPDGVDASTGASRLIVGNDLMGHVEHLAGIIERETGADVFRITTVQHYPASHQPLIEQANEEKANNARPKLATRIANPEQYDTIFIGYPNWWGDLPMPLYTFLESYDFAGKTIVPFNSHGGSGLSSTVATIREKQPDATVANAFTVSRNSVGSAEADLIAWLDGLDITE